MSSERKIAANRLNAQKSKGPRTKAGKARASRNAVRHGLAATIHRDPYIMSEIERMAWQICAGDSNQAIFEQAIILAEAELLLRAVRAQRIAVIERLYDTACIPLVKGDNCCAYAKTH